MEDILHQGLAGVILQQITNKRQLRVRPRTLDYKRNSVGNYNPKLITIFNTKEIRKMIFQRLDIT
jgi:hypothetical protein